MNASLLGEGHVFFSSDYPVHPTTYMWFAETHNTNIFFRQLGCFLNGFFQCYEQHKKKFISIVFGVKAEITEVDLEMWTILFVIFECTKSQFYSRRVEAVSSIRVANSRALNNNNNNKWCILLVFGSSLLYWSVQTYHLMVYSALTRTTLLLHVLVYRYFLYTFWALQTGQKEFLIERALVCRCAPDPAPCDVPSSRRFPGELQWQRAGRPGAEQHGQHHPAAPSQLPPGGVLRTNIAQQPHWGRRKLRPWI